MEKSIKEYANLYHYNTNYLSGIFRQKKESSLPDILSVRKVGNNWMITLVQKEEKVLSKQENTI